MPAFTVIETKLKHELAFVTQQHQVGLYVIINNDPTSQFGVDMSEEKYHKGLIRKAIKMGDSIKDSTYMEYATIFKER